LELLDSPHPSLRWRAAEVAATCAQNNPDVQKAFLEGGALLRLLPLLHDADSTVQTKALLAISCLVRGYPPALIQLRQQDGPQLLIRLLAQPEPRLQRKCLQVLQYMLRVVPLDRLPACEAGLVPALRCGAALLALLRIVLCCPCAFVPLCAELQCDCDAALAGTL
jgi:hsp70-interacting protein